MVATTLTPVDHEGAPMIDARTLHGWLGTRERFNDWVQRRVDEYGFEAGEDFYRNFSKSPSGRGRPRTDYLLTIDTAKELAMIERTPKGRATRRCVTPYPFRGKGGVTTPSPTPI